MRIYVTNGVTQDGLGARFQRVVNLMAFAVQLRDKFKLNIHYIHTPLWYEGFGVDFTMGESIRGGVDYPLNLQSAKQYRVRTVGWEKEIGYFGKTVTDIKYNNYKVGIDNLWRDIADKKCDGNIYVITHLNTEFDLGIYDINMIVNHRDEIRERFRFLDLEGDDVACHIRRSDATGQRYVDDDYYLRMLTKYPNAIIYTQKVGFSSEKYNNFVIRYDDKVSDTETLSKLANAKTLIMGNSSLSYVAALLNGNTVIYKSMQHIKQKHWIQYE